ncbi:hypothetical protein CU633_12335 [Bacillus sp. V3-13]|uniref:hypothetical protein n=1 Tax=Bacillus sp. V3-13 TaxID=2053728 RepID=UPI000C77064D|nr:hypothetical protein [Bacillus sp. V3-13]PLR77005.1 hypothetical protein CU633_12335 [Bacillus sp. V3-13]
MKIFKLYLISLIEIFLFLCLGFILTRYILKPIYELNGVRFEGNVGIVWFGFSFILFSIYTLIWAKLRNNQQQSTLIKERLSSFTFWFIFASSIVVVILPFLNGKMY